ncbi:phage holin family protein [Streptococcus anginosus]|uniref:Holin n=2 Tax=Streptococcus anginosus TaxID=1328 RepID=A0A412PLB5_STRAP|nr:phage holin family protein [Streptococcus anginosus]MCW0972216.1 phage holin family protein [Streptococcus anginosus]MCW1013002.1 phage holin family protein [Streptococcus anginosus]MCW1017101.1 phage holin family protein [Streptococcus anginosus]MCW1030654.1 phage holin family protein [Streptococcus anginosus]MCW1038932.1 phage holin family protein [Streptococcus anginosus]
MSFVNFEWSHALRGFVDTQDKLIAFTLTLIMGAMVIDFLTGTLAAKINPKIEFKSKEGINGVLRKISSIALLAFCIPLSILLPEGIGLGTLQVLYLGYLFFEMKSVLENFEKLGIDTALFKEFFEVLKKYLKDKGEK